MSATKKQKTSDSTAVAAVAQSKPQHAADAKSKPFQNLFDENDDPKMFKIIEQGNHGQLVIIGFPHDEGVERNGGRVGARRGPDAVRKLLPKIGTVVNPEHGVDLRAIRISDAGNIGEGSTLEEAHTALRAAVRVALERNAIPFVLGGGNDQSYPNAAALLDVYGASAGAVGVINIDAHLDVRPLTGLGLAHSGSPFRQLLEDTRFDGHHFCEFGAQGQQCSAPHADYVKRKKGRIVYMSNIRTGTAAERFREELDNMSRSCAAIFVSFDIDSIAGADCPGVSAVAPYGLSARDALEICLIAGAHDKVCLMDASEYNPDVEEYRTGRLVCNMLYYFALGVATRLGRQGVNRI